MLPWKSETDVRRQVSSPTTTRSSGDTVTPSPEGRQNWILTSAVTVAPSSDIVCVEEDG